MGYTKLINSKTYSNVKIERYDHDARILQISLAVFDDDSKKRILTSIPFSIMAYDGGEVAKVEALPEKAERNTQVRIGNEFYINVADNPDKEIENELGQIEARVDLTAKWEKIGNYLDQAEWDERFAFSNFDGTNGKNPVQAIYQYLSDFNLIEAESDI